MVNETKKILHKNIAVSATCVRVPVLRGHSEAVTIKCKKAIDLSQAIAALKKMDSVVVENDSSHGVYPMPFRSTGKNDTFVGRIRVDTYDPTMLHLWVVADNLRVGAATNAVKIAMEWIKTEGEQ